MKNRNTILAAILLALACFAVSPKAQAVSPAPDGGYPGGNTAEGADALLSLTGGVWNTALGFQALNHDTVGGNNTATGVRALFSDTGGNYNSATGVYALHANINGWYNSAVGAYALANNISGNYNTANGYGALYSNTADRNTATGFGALYRNTTGDSNTANGYLALNRNTTGFSNSAFGRGALASNTIGSVNTAEGVAALGANTTGAYNTANGVEALERNTAADSNTADGADALEANDTGALNTAVGTNALHDNVAGNGNTAIGEGAGYNVTGHGNVAIGQGVAGVAGLDGQTWIRNINSTVQPPINGADYVTVRLSDGLLGHTSSSRRYKEDIAPMDTGSEVVYQVKPVTYRYKKNIDPSQNLDYGLVAEDVAKVDPKLAIRDGKGQIESVRYTAIYNMLLNEFLKEHKKVAEQQTSITRLKSAVAKQEALVVEQQKNFQSKLAEEEKQIEALASGLQKVSAQIEVSKPAGRVVLNNHNGENPKAETESKK